MNPLNQFWKKYIDDDSADISIAKRKQEISRWLLIYALVVLVFRGVAFVVYGAELLFLGETIFHYGFDLSFIALFPFYTLPFFMWLYSVRASRPEELLEHYLFLDKNGLLLTVFLAFFLGYWMVVIIASILWVNLLITKKLTRLEQRRVSEETTSLAEAKSESAKMNLLRTEANAMLFAYGIAALYPRLMGSFMRVGIWDFVFSGMPRSWWNIALYSSIPFVVCLYSVKTKKADKLVLGYSLWLFFEAQITFSLNILWFWWSITLGGTEISAVVTPELELGNTIFSGFLCFFVCNMSKKYAESFHIQNGLSGTVKIDNKEKRYVLIVGALVGIFLMILLPGRITVLASILFSLNLIIHKIFKKFRVLEYFGESVTTNPTSDLILASDKGEGIDRVFVAKSTLFLVVFSHVLYALEASL